MFNENMERFSIAQKAPATRELYGGRPMRARGELSAETCWSSKNSKHGKPVCAPPQKQDWGFYAMINFVCTAKIDFWNVQPNAADGTQRYKVGSDVAAAQPLRWRAVAEAGARRMDCVQGRA